MLFSRLLHSRTYIYTSLQFHVKALSFIQVSYYTLNIWVCVTSSTLNTIHVSNAENSYTNTGNKHVAMCVCVCIYTHTHTHTHIYIKETPLCLQDQPIMLSPLPPGKCPIPPLMAQYNIPGDLNLDLLHLG